MTKVQSEVGERAHERQGPDERRQDGEVGERGPLDPARLRSHLLLP